MKCGCERGKLYEIPPCFKNTHAFKTVQPKDEKETRDLYDKM